MEKYKKYIFEREGMKLIESEHGFVSYGVDRNHLYIGDMYVEPQYRANNIARRFIEILNEIAKKEKCTQIIARIRIADRGRSVTMAASLKVGFQIHSIDRDSIIISKAVV